MENDRLIKVHCDEVMREHLEFMTRRYLHEMMEWQRRGNNTGYATMVSEEIQKTQQCLTELQQAGT